MPETEPQPQLEVHFGGSDSEESVDGIPLTNHEVNVFQIIVNLLIRSAF